MNSVQRIQKFLSGLCMLLGSLLLVVEPESGYYTEYISVGLSVPTSVESNGGTAYLAVGGEDEMGGIVVMKIN